MEKRRFGKGSAMASALAFSKRVVELKAEREQVMNLKVPKFHVEFPEDAEFGYGYGETTMDLDRSLEMYAGILPKLMSLAEVEAATGVSAAVIIEQLGLPESTSRSEQLKLLKERHEFEMHALREIVAQQLDRQ